MQRHTYTVLTPMKTFSYPTAAIALFILTLGLSACGDSEPETRITEREALPVRVQQVVLENVPEAYHYAGVVRGKHKAQLSTKLMGRVTFLDVEEGDRVQKGQVLLRIQNEDLSAQKAQVEAHIREAQAAFESAETNFERMKSLYASESATKKEFEDATTQFEMARAQMAALESRLHEVNDLLSYTRLTAPMSGYVVQKNADVGDMASPGMPLLAVENTGSLEVIATVPETDIPRFAPGDPVAIEISALGETVKGTVAQINPSSHANSRQFDVQVTINDGEAVAGIKSGMYARVMLQKSERAVIAVPEEALTRYGQLTGLYTIDGQNRALLRWVRTGKKIGNDVEILSGLTAGESYVTVYEGRLTDGQTVKILN